MVKLMVVGKGKGHFPPSMNLITEQFNGTLKDYLRKVVSFNKAQGQEWKDLGTLMTQSGEASLSQAIQETPYGKVQMLHAILLKDGTIYLLTASSLQEEFPSHTKAFYEALKSLKVG